MDINEYIRSEKGQQFLTDADNAKAKLMGLLGKIKHSADTGPDGEFCILTSEESFLIWRLLTLTKQVL